jgi:hypothetical protein
MPRTVKTTTERGLGWQHKQQRARLIARLHDGDPCSCLTLDDCGPSCPCRRAGHGLPMYRDAALNVDAMPLEADHTVSRSQGGQRADRLLIATCNRSRGDGTRSATGAFLIDPARDWTRDWTGDGLFKV